MIPQYADYIRILPEIVLSIFGMVIMLLDPLLDDRRSRTLSGALALVGSFAAFAATFVQAQSPGYAFCKHGACRFLQYVSFTSSSSPSPPS